MSVPPRGYAVLVAPAHGELGPERDMMGTAPAARFTPLRSYRPGITIQTGVGGTFLNIVNFLLTMLTG